MYLNQEELDKIREGDLEEANKVITRAVGVAVESAMRSLPSMAVQLIKTAMARKNLSDKYLSDHKEFAKHPDLMKGILEQVEIANAGEPPETILEKAAPRVEEAIKQLQKLEV